MTFVEFLKLLKSDIANYRAGRLSLNKLVRSLETVEQLNLVETENFKRSCILEVVSELETINAIILFDNARAEKLQSDIGDLLSRIDNLIDAENRTDHDLG